MDDDEGGDGLIDYSAYDYSRSHNIDKTTGDYAITEKWTLAKTEQHANVVEDINTELQNQQDSDKVKTITVNGQLTGLESKNMSLVTTQSKYEAALERYAYLTTGQHTISELIPGVVTASLDYLPAANVPSWNTRTVNISAYAGKTVKVVFHYVQSDSGVTYFGDIQLDDINIDGTNYSFESSAPTGWETSVAYGDGNVVAGTYEDISSYDDADFQPLETDVHQGRWNRDEGGTSSTDTGLTTGNTGDYYLYAECSAQTSGAAGSNRAYSRGFFLRTVDIQLSSNPTLSYAVAQYGTEMGDLNVHLDVYENVDSDVDFEEGNLFYLLAKNSSLHTVAGIQAPFITKTVSHNEEDGSISFTYSFNNREQTITGKSTSETISIDIKEAEDQYAIIPIFGRSSGPIVQNLNTPTSYEATVNAEIIMGDQYRSTGPPVITETTGSLWAKVWPPPNYVLYSPVLVSQNESWDPVSGTFNRTKTYRWLSSYCPTFA